jgi:hypothetical protein
MHYLSLSPTSQPLPERVTTTSVMASLLPMRRPNSARVSVSAVAAWGRTTRREMAAFDAFCLRSPQMAHFPRARPSSHESPKTAPTDRCSRSEGETLRSRKRSFDRRDGECRRQQCKTLGGDHLVPFGGDPPIDRNRRLALERGQPASFSTKRAVARNRSRAPTRVPCAIIPSIWA